MSAPIPLLEVRDFGLEFRTRSGTVHALADINLAIHKGETVGLVGESGSGKSVLSYAILGISDRAAKVTGGTAVFGGLDLLKAKESELADIRGREVSMIFQNPRTALNPIRKIGKQIEDVLKRHAAVPGIDLKRRAIEALREVNIPDPERRYHAYPFELSGGMCQRVMIALALACKPALLVADEPTTGLDVTTQAGIMDLINGLASAATRWRPCSSPTTWGWPPITATASSSCTPAMWSSRRRCASCSWRRSTRTRRN